MSLNAMPGTSCCVNWAVPVSGGPFALYVVADPEGIVDELDEGNNKYAEDIPELNIIFGDLVVESVEIWPV